MAIPFLERGRSMLGRIQSPIVIEMVREKDPHKQFHELQHERTALWLSMHGTDSLPHAGKAAYGLINFMDSEEESTLPPQDANERIYANLLRRYKAGHTSPKDFYLVAFSEERTRLTSVSMLQVFTTPHIQALAAGEEDMQPVLRITEMSQNKGEQYEISILAEKDAFVSGSTPDDIAGIDSQTGELIWNLAGEEDIIHRSDIASKQAFYKAALTHINRMVQAQGNGIENNQLVHNTLQNEGGYNGSSDLFSLEQTFEALNAVQGPNT